MSTAIAAKIVQSVPTRPLVVRFGSMGDMVISLALIHALHKRFGTPVDVISSGSWTRPLLESQPGVGKLYLIRSRKKPYAFSPEQWQLVRTLRERGPSPTWICDANDKIRWLIAHAGIPDEYIADVRSLTPVAREHAVDRWIRFAAASPAALRGPTGIVTKPKVPPLNIPEAWRTDLDQWLRKHDLLGRPLVLIQAGNRRTMKWARPRKRASNTKYWPEQRWAEVIDSIAASHPDARILLTGVPQESALNREILDLSATPRAYDVATDLPMNRLLALQERAIGMVSVDTGPAHSAAALGCPLVVLFGTASLDHYAPRSRTGAVICLREYDQGTPSMLAITADQVIDAWKSLQDGEWKTRIGQRKMIGATNHGAKWVA
jgi:heptosyltransferase-2/heptosyltransferase-3